MPYLGPVIGAYTDWTPIENRGILFPEELDRDDPWQFTNVIVRMKQDSREPIMGDITFFHSPQSRSSGVKVLLEELGAPYHAETCST